MTPITPESLHSASYVTPEELERRIMAAIARPIEPNTPARFVARVCDLVSKHSNDAELGAVIRALVGGDAGP